MFRSCLLLPGAARLFPAQLHWDGSSKSWALPQMTGEIGGAQQNIEQLVSLQSFQIPFRQRPGWNGGANLVDPKKIGIEFLGCENFWDLFWDLD